MRPAALATVPAPAPAPGAAPGLALALAITLALAAAACGVSGSSPSGSPPLGTSLVGAAPVPPPAARTLVVMSYNVNFGLAGDPAGLDAIRAGAADLVVLQETTPGWEDAIRADADLAARYPHMRFRHCCGAGGLAFLSRHPLDEREYVPPPVEGAWFPAWRVVVAAPAARVQVLAVHLRPPLDERGSLVGGYLASKPIRRAEIEHHAALLDRDPSVPALVVGDFNEDAEGGALAFLAARGLRSALHVLDPTATTWRWTTAVGTVTARLDHIVHDARLAAVDARVLPRGRSDHFPVVATFALP